MKNFLIVVDMQKDFVNGALGSKEAEAIVPAVVKKIKDFDGKIFVTYDTHFDNYLNTMEGKKLPVPHCIKGTDGWQLDGRVEEALEGKDYTKVEKPTFAAAELPPLLYKESGGEDFSIELIGLCTDICVVSNALLLKAIYCENEIIVDSSCCAGVTPELHDAALKTMKSCHITVI